MRKIILFFSLFMFFNLSAQKKMKDYSEIMRSKSIYEINAFLRDAHPDDPRRSVLKPRIMEMIRDYIKTAHPADPRVKSLQEMLATLKRRPSTKISFDEMNAIIKQKQIAKYKEALAKNLNPATMAPVTITAEPVTAAVPGQRASSAAPSTPTFVAMPSAEEDEFKMLINESPEAHKQKTVQLLNKLFDSDPSSRESIILIQNKSDCNIIVRIEGAGNTKYRLAVAAHNENSIVVTKGDYLFTSIVCGAQYASQKTVQKAIMVGLSNPGSK
ncbi:DUF6759 domain-containing protein [Chryseobacterium sp.]|uniref:DUF6759 domain-containing protein n=1 Tax=Chryseobacterium sp. TaxID=1871047 RepID=UPI0011CAFFFE|nr:DUF6759 domain-containing protein [Chryseobacterium sp.]TXF77207.1 hypothetical protein FUA25_04515 [Chryseobacterium sp.]